MIFLASREDKSHFHEKPLSVLPYLGLIPENITEQSQSRSKNKIELNFSLMNEISLGKLWDVETPTEYKIFCLFDPC
jgi:hypothetical protein